MEDAFDYLKPLLYKLKKKATGADGGKSLFEKAAFAKSLYEKALSGDQPAVIVHRRYNIPLSKF